MLIVFKYIYAKLYVLGLVNPCFSLGLWNTSDINMLLV